VCVSMGLLSVSQPACVCVCVYVYTCMYICIVYTIAYISSCELNFLCLYVCMYLCINQCNCYCYCRWQHFRFARTHNTHKEKIENAFRRRLLCTFSSVHLAPNSKFRRALISFDFLSNFLLYARAHTLIE